MPGGLVQVVFIGNQDKMLTQLPEITWFKIKYCRHTDFAIQDYLLQPEQNINLSLTKKQFNSTEFILRQYADLVFRPMLKITLPDVDFSLIVCELFVLISFVCQCVGRDSC
jgi:hypothetical protein